MYGVRQISQLKTWMCPAWHGHFITAVAAQQMVDGAGAAVQLQKATRTVSRRLVLMLAHEI